MRQAVMVAPGEIEIRDVPAPAPQPGEVLLRVQRIGICGSDVHVNHGRHPYTRYPVVQGHEFSAVIEAVAYEYAYYLGIEKALLPEAEFVETRVVGGGARSGLWSQIKADVLGLPYVRLNREEFAVLGSAIVAGYAVGVFDDLKATARRFVQTTDRIEPRPEHHRFYQSYVEQYVALLSETAPFYRRLATLPQPPGGGVE